VEGIVDVQDTTNYWLGHYLIFVNFVLSEIVILIKRFKVDVQVKE